MFLYELQAVYEALSNNAGIFLSISEINAEIRKENGVIFEPRTIVNKIDQLKITGHTINERTEPKGANRIPTKTFQYISNFKNDEHSSNQIND